MEDHEEEKTGGAPRVAQFARNLFGDNNNNNNNNNSQHGNNNNHNNNHRDYDANGGGDDAKLRKKKQIAQWPHDDYHEIQTRYYKKVDSKKKQEEPTPNYVHRPQDMVDIPTAVQNLPLAEFETTAQDRAIGIVSTWIFDAGLIDELLLETTQNTSAPASVVPVTATNNGSANGTNSSDAAAKEKTGGGGLKMDKEILKLREQTERDLRLIDNRLNDGVAASGSEVQELVNAVEATKSDLVRLASLATSISNGGNATEAHTFLLTPYPKLKTAINARRNLARCFRELDFFSQIPHTCERLREQLTQCEWTDHEWTTIRDVCREHVELQIFLVEAEVGMKARLEKEQQEEEEKYNTYNNAGYNNAYQQSTNGSSAPSRGMRKLGNSIRYAPTENNHESVDRFLREHVKNVWEVGDEIRLRVLSGIGAALDLSAKDPAGMVALVEAVEVYESAADEFRRVHGGIDPTKGLTSSSSSPSKSNNHGRMGSSSENKYVNAITDMRRAALEQIAEDFHGRAETQFESMINKAKDAVPQDAGGYRDYEAEQNAEFNAVLRASQDLIIQIQNVQRFMSPCFPPFWNVETLWMTFCASVCSQHILRNIGGEKGSDLDRMTVTQLLDLVAWIESFRDKVEGAFPNEFQSMFQNRHGQHMEQFKPLKELMQGKQLDMDSAKENLSIVTNVLWGVKAIAQQKFINRTNDQTAQWLDNVYKADHAKSQTADGKLITSLPEDIFALAGVQLRTIRERLTKKSGVLVDAVTMVFIAMLSKQAATKKKFCQDLETSCAASNDFYRMQDQCDEIVEELLDSTELTENDQNTVREMGNSLTIQYANDAAYAAQSIHKYIFDPIEEELREKLFSSEWEPPQRGPNDFGPKTDFGLTIVRTIEDFTTDIEEWMEADMVRKLYDALVRASINFYIKMLLLKTEKKGKGESSKFLNPKAATQQISHDIDKIRSFFERKTDEWPPFQRVINAEFEIVKDIFGLMFVAANDGDDPDNFFPSIQKKVKDVNLCRAMIGDFYHLVAPEKERDIYELFARHEEDLRAFEMNYDSNVNGMTTEDEALQLAVVVRNVVAAGQRKRPIKGEAQKGMEKAFGKLGFGGGGGGGGGAGNDSNDEGDGD